MTEFTLIREVDVSGVSGTGEVAWGVEWPDGAVAIRWPGEHPSTAAWNDIRGPEAIHGHGGKTVVQYRDSDRLVRAYERIMPYLLASRYEWLPVTVGRHVDFPDRLRLTFVGEKQWRWWTALLDGSTDAATHVDQAGEIRHRWISPDGDLWLEYFSPCPPVDQYPDDNPYDPRD